VKVLDQRDKHKPYIFRSLLIFFGSEVTLPGLSGLFLVFKIFSRPEDKTLQKTPLFIKKTPHRKKIHIKTPNLI